MSGALFFAGRRRPPRTWLRRLLWAIVVFVFAAALLPFVVIGIAETYESGHMLEAAVFSALALMLLFAAGAAVFEGVRAIVARV